jgi:DNA polymerase (family 10)
MTNHELANTFRLIADLLDIQGEVIYVTLAYRKVADNLEALGRDVNEVWREGKLREIPGVGKAIADKIDELVRTGHLGFLDRLQSEVPASLAELLRVPDLGPKKINLFWRSLGVTTLAQLEAAARGGQLRSLSGMGAKSEAKILAGLESLARRSGRTPLGAAYPLAVEMLAVLRRAPGVVDAALGGSLRRMKSTVGDLDLLVAAANSAAVMQAFVSQPGVARILGQGSTKASVEFVNGLRAQLWVHPPERFGTALQYATGSKEHNVRLRQLALDRGLSLSDQAFMRSDGSEILCASEAEVYTALGLPWIAPELREDRGEIQAALAGRLPTLIEPGQRRAELHSHSTWSDGRASIREMALAAQSRGLQVLAITDHSGGLGITGGLSLEDIARQRAEIGAVQQEFGDSLRLLQGTEVEIRADGTLDYSDEVLAQFDIVIASLHTSLRQPRAQVTERLLHAVRNPHVDIIGHPSGRLIPDREGADLDMDVILAAAAASGVALEINANPNRLDLDDVYARRAMEMDIRLAINTDAHDPDHLAQEVFGIATARRAWVEPQHVINTWQPDALLAWLGSRKCT